jgi:hypothetical protein
MSEKALGDMHVSADARIAAESQVRAFQLPARFLQRLRRARGRLSRPVTKALALTPRGFIPNDVPSLRELSGQLRVVWHARRVAPWDRHLPSARQAALFSDLTMRDTDAAIRRLFEELPEVHSLEVQVLEPVPANRPLITGTVLRDEALAVLSLASPRMRLKMMGVRYDLIDGQLNPL